MPGAASVNKEVRYKKQSALGTVATNTGGQLIRRRTANFNIVKDTYGPTEKISDFQRTDFRHGTQRAEIAIDGDLSPGTYADLIGSVLKRDFTGTVVTSDNDITADAGAKTFTRATGDYLADGWRVGMVGRWSGWTGGGAANNAKNMRVVAVTATVLTVAETVASMAAGDSVTFTMPGKQTYTPLTAHTNDLYTLEEWYPDIARDELFLDCRMGGMTLELPATGIAGINLTALGRSRTKGTAAYFGSPTAAPSTGVAAAVSGVLRVGSLDVAVVTALTIRAGIDLSTIPVIGSNLSPDVFTDSVLVGGQLSAIFEDHTLVDAFDQETELELWAMLTLGSAAAADFLSFYMGRIKLTGAAKDESGKAVVQTIPFEAIRRNTGAGYQQTTLLVQDSTLT